MSEEQEIEEDVVDRLNADVEVESNSPQQEAEQPSNTVQEVEPINLQQEENNPFAQSDPMAQSNPFAQSDPLNLQTSQEPEQVNVEVDVLDRLNVSEEAIESEHQAEVVELLDQNTNLSDEQRENILEKVEEKIETLLENDIEPTDKMIEVLVEQEIKTEEQQEQEFSYDMGR